MFSIRWRRGARYTWQTKQNASVLGLLSDNYIDVNLNIKYLIKYGVSNIDKIVYNNINDFIVSHSEFINVIKNYEKSLSKDEIIMLYENK